MARNKVKIIPVIKNWDEIDIAMKEIAMAEIEISKIEDKMDKEIANKKEVAKETAKPHHVKIEMLEKDIKEFVEQNKDEIDGKTKLLNFGKTGFRKSTKLVVPSKIEAVAKIIESLRKRKMTDCIVKKESVNKEALKQYPENTIIEVGASLKTADTFWYETDHAKLKM